MTDPFVVLMIKNIRYLNNINVKLNSKHIVFISKYLKCTNTKKTSIFEYHSNFGPIVFTKWLFDFMI